MPGTDGPVASTEISSSSTPGNTSTVEAYTTPPGAAPSKDFTARANSICRLSTVALIDVQESLGPPVDKTSSVRIDKAVQSELAKRVRELKELTPTASIADAYDELITADQGQVAAFDQILQAFEDDDPVAGTEGAKALVALSSKSREAGAEAGLGVCAAELSQDSQDEVRDVVETAFSTNDPKVICHELASKYFLEAQFGGVARCEAAQRAEPDLPDDIDISDLHGVDGVTAETDVTVHGGTRDGSELHVTLVEEDDGWRIQQIASPPGDLPQPTGPAVS